MNVIKTRREARGSGISVYSEIMYRLAVIAVAASLALAAPKAKVKPKVAAKPSLSERLEETIRESPATARAHIGMRVMAVESMSVLYERNAGSWFIPASNTKLYSTALALVRLGPVHRFRTQVVVDELPDDAGVVQGDLRLVGGGDPSLSGRQYPYDRHTKWKDGMAAIEEMADVIVSRGVKAIDGAVVGDDTRYRWEPYPPGWAADDGLYEYGAPVSALTLNDNAIRYTIQPGPRVGDVPRLTVNPAIEYFTIQNRLTTAGPGYGADVNHRRAAGSRELTFEGHIGLGEKPSESILGVDDPARFAAQALYEALSRRGVVARDGFRAAHRLQDLDGRCAECRYLAERESPPLDKIIQVVNKVSQNLHAELLLREVSMLEQENHGTRAGGAKALRTFLESLGLAADDTFLVDGSGLSRLTLVTPHATTTLLAHMAKHVHREPWIKSLPIGAEDGTLSKRFRGYADAARVRAKTGSLSHVAALAGYLEHPRRGLLAFSLMANNYNADATDVRKTLDKMVMTLLEY